VELTRQELQPPGRVAHVRARDLDGDGTAELLAVARQDGEDPPVRRLAYWSPTARGFAAAPTQVLVLPRDAVAVDACDVGLGPGAEILVLTETTLSAFVRDGPGPYPATPRPLLDLGLAHPLPDEDDAPFLELCRFPRGGGSPELWLPGLGGVTVALVTPEGIVQEGVLDVRPRASSVAGDEYRGPRARRDFALLTTLVLPRLTSLDADGDGDDDLYATLEDTVALYPRQDGRLQHRPAWRGSLGLKSATDRARKNAVLDVLLGDLTGDGLPDAVVTKLTGGVASLQTATRVHAGLGLAGFQAVPVATRVLDGYAMPLCLVGVEEGKAGILEPSASTAPLSVAGMVIKQRIDLDVRVVRLRGVELKAGRGLGVSLGLDVSGLGNVRGGLPLVGQDVDGDGLPDAVTTGRGDRVEVSRGRKGDPPFHEDEAFSARVGPLRRVEWYVPRPGAPASVVVLGVTASPGLVVFWNPRGAPSGLVQAPR
jgi:hypothetical protein